MLVLLLLTSFKDLIQSENFRVWSPVTGSIGALWKDQCWITVGIIRGIEPSSQQDFELFNSKFGTKRNIQPIQYTSVIFLEASLGLCFLK
jgi:hypothetical protein